MDEKTNSASIFAHFLVYLEKILIFFTFGHVHSIWVWSHNFWDKTNPNNVFKSWEYFQRNNGSGFFIFILDFIRWLKMYLNIEKPWFFENYHIFQYIIKSTQKTRMEIKNQEPLYCSHRFGETGFVFVLAFFFSQTQMERPNC